MFEENPFRISPLFPLSPLRKRQDFEEKFWRAFQTRPTLETFLAVKEPLFSPLNGPRNADLFGRKKLTVQKRVTFAIPPLGLLHLYFYDTHESMLDGTLPLPRHKATLFSLILAQIVVGRHTLKVSKISNTSVQFQSRGGIRFLATKDIDCSSHETIAPPLF